jgi:tetratricopeptide (TPR) repeat protein
MEATAAQNELPIFEQLKKDPAIAAALAAGDPKRLYAVLRARRGATNDALLKRAIEQALANRRNFVSPVRRTPSLMTVNGFGFKLYGHDQHDRTDGSYIATLWAVLLFVPLYPAGQYLVRWAGGQTFQFLGELPLSDALRWWRRLSGVGVALIAAALGLGIWFWSTHNDVLFVNDLDAPVRIAFDRETIDLGPGQRMERGTRTGRHSVRVSTVTGELIEEQAVEVPAHRDVVVYNVAGAAPLYREEIVYYEDHAEAKRAPPGRMEDHSLETWIVADASFVFSAPPESIQMGNHERQSSRWRFDTRGGVWRAAFANFRSDGQKLRAAAVTARKIARVQRGDVGALATAVEVVRIAEGAEEAAALARGAIDGRPDWVDGHRIYQDAMGMAGHAEECAAAYRARYAAQPDSAVAAYLAGREGTVQGALAIYGPAIAKHPDDPYLRRGRASALLWLRRYAEAAADFEALVGITKDSHEVLDAYVKALIGAGRAEHALAELVRYGDGRPKVDLDMATLYARVLQKVAPAEAPHPSSYYFGRLEGQMAPALARAVHDLRTGAGLGDGKIEGASDDARTALLIEDAARRDAGRLVSLADRATLEVVHQSDAVPMILLAGELYRRGDKRWEGVLARQLDGEGGAEVIRRSLVGGVEAPGFEQLDFEMQAALRFLRGRAASSPSERERLYRLARADDLLSSTVTSAIEHWKQP